MAVQSNIPPHWYKLYEGSIRKKPRTLEDIRGYEKEREDEGKKEERDS